MAKNLQLAPIRVGLEASWPLRESYRKVVRRHNLRTIIALILGFPLFAFLTIILAVPFSESLSRNLRVVVCVGALGIELTVFLAFLLWRAKKDCTRFHLQCPACGKDLYSSKRMGVWLDGDTQSIGWCPHCRQAIQCPREGITLSAPVEGAPIPAHIWERRRWIQRWRTGVLLWGLALMWGGFLFSSWLRRHAVLHPDKGPLPLVVPLLMVLCPFALMTWILRSSAAMARKRGVVCSRCAEPLVGRRVVQEEAPPRLICLACGTLMRVEA